MEITDELRELIIIGASAIELRRKAIELGMITLRESGLCKIREGITTIEEVVKETVLVRIWRKYVSQGNCIIVGIVDRDRGDHPAWRRTMPKPGAQSDEIQKE